jgi:hypothetical protein
MQRLMRDMEGTLREIGDYPVGGLLRLDTGTTLNLLALICTSV